MARNSCCYLRQRFPCCQCFPRHYSGLIKPFVTASAAKSYWLSCRQMHPASLAQVAGNSFYYHRQRFPVVVSSNILFLYQQLPSIDCHADRCILLYGHRWPGTHLPVVKFVNGRQETLLPELFTADVASVGTCKRLQVTHSH